MKQSKRMILGMLGCVLMVGLILPIGPAEGKILLHGLSEEIVDLTSLVTLLSEGDNFLTFEVQVPWEQLEVNQLTIEDQNFTSLRIPDWSNTSESGAPALPFISQVIGVPFGVEVELDIAPGESHTLSLKSPILPALTQVADTPDVPLDQLGAAFPQTQLSVQANKEIYNGLETSYPSHLAEVSHIGILRQQRVAGINIFPFQYQPKNAALIVYESLIVRVNFIGKVQFTEASTRPESPIYEDLFEDQLLNTYTAKNWRSDELGSYNDMQIQSSVANAAPWTPPAPGWRVLVNQDGIYKLTYTDLQNAGFDLDDLDPRSLQLFHLGQEVAIDVVGEADGQFNLSDQIVFFGKAPQSKYSPHNVYWLTSGKVAQGQRISFREAAPAEADILTAFDETFIIEENNYYIAILQGDDDLERWLMTSMKRLSTTPTSVSYPLQVGQLPDVVNGVLSIDLFGWTSLPLVYPDHHLIVDLNGIQIAEIWWDGKTKFTAQIDLEKGVLVSGDNTLTLTCPVEVNGITMDAFYVDKISLAYKRSYTASENELAFSEMDQGTWRFLMDGFSSSEVRVLDVTNPVLPVELTGLLYGDPLSVEFQDNIESPKEFWAFEPLALQTPLSIELDQASNLQANTNSADHITITHPLFLEQAEDLRDFRITGGMRAVAVELQDIYDEFNYGIPDVKAIRNFLAYAYTNWQAPAPSYVVLLGDGHYDPKNSFYSKPNFIPTYLAYVDPWLGETSSDNRFVTIVGDDVLPDMMLGRMAVNSPAEAEVMVNKVINFEQNPEPGDWQKLILAVTDNSDSAGNFAQLSDSLLASSLPEPYQADRIYYDGTTYPTTAAATAAIVDSFNSGTLLVNYIGHAGYNQWTGEGIFKTSHLSQLTNSVKQPVVLAMTCYDGYFHYPLDNYDAMAESITRAQDKGAVASWSPTGLGVASGHDYLNRGFYDAIFKDGMETIGEGTQAGKLRLWATGFNQDLLDTYLLFGDPALKMPIVFKPDLAQIPGQTIYPGQSFTPFDLKDYTVDHDHDLSELTFSFSGNLDLTVNLVDGLVTIIPLSVDWLGTETITFRATDPDDHWDEIQVTFTVAEWPYQIYLPITVK